MAACLMSCTRKEGVPMTFNVTVAEMKADKTSWADGDKIYVFFNGLETKYLVLEHSGDDWAPSSGGGTLLDTDFDGLGTYKFTAVHFPVDVTVTYADSKFSFTGNGKPVYNYYLFEADKDYTVSGTTVNAFLWLGKPADMVQIHVAGIQESVDDYTFGCSKIKPVACSGVGIDGSITESVLQAGARMCGVADADGAVFSGRLVYPSEAKDYKFTVASDTQVYTLTRTSKILTAGKRYTFPSLSTTGGSNWTAQNASDLYVDLGLSVKWAKCNLGAEHDYDYGDYFAWGEITGHNEGKTNFAWSTYAWGASTSTLTKYCNKSSNGLDGFTDGLTTLEKEDDAAYAALGGKWRMPTSEEIIALIATKSNTTDYTWTWCDGSATKYNDTDIAGWMIVKNATSATLFFPAAGRWGETIPANPGSNGYYWCSSLYTDDPTSALSFGTNTTNARHGNYIRYRGFSVRPVIE